ncbi:E3 ubiquitin-protein ligase rnf213-alpha-like, partial [Stylophora pistillata]|uniref:E3 ubiquitin-protein ligase rnf213-alpha-like n=1 Tax=Stylophora pistillata TaxID=50429 RepID=UPI000C03CF72
MEQVESGARHKRFAKPFCRNVYLIRNSDFRGIDGQSYMPTQSELANLRKSPDLYKQKVTFYRNMSEKMVMEKLEETFPYLSGKSYTCTVGSSSPVKCMSTSHDEYAGIWDGETIWKNIQGNSALYILEVEMNSSNDLAEASERLQQPCSTEAMETSQRFSSNETAIKGLNPWSTNPHLFRRSSVKDSSSLVTDTNESSPFQNTTHLPSPEAKFTSETLELYDITSSSSNILTTSSHNGISEFADEFPLEDLPLDEEIPEVKFDSNAEKNSFEGLCFAYPKMADDDDHIGTSEINNCEHFYQDCSLNSTEMSDSSADNTNTTSGISGFDHNQSLDDLSPHEDERFDFRVTPEKVPLQGSDLCRFKSDRAFPRNVQFALAIFEHLETVNVKRFGDDSLVGEKIPPSKTPGWVKIFLQRADGKVLGETKICYYDQDKEALQRIIENPKLQADFFRSYSEMLICHNTTTVSGAEAQNYGICGSSEPVQMLCVLVYAAAEIGGEQFIKMIFNSSAGRVVHDHCKDNPAPPKAIAREFGHEKIATYLEGITGRYSKESNDAPNYPQTIDWSELVTAAEEAQKQPILSSEEKGNHLERNALEDTGYLGDIETSSNESCESVSPESEDSIPLETSKESGHYSDGTPTTTDPDNKGFGRDEEIANGVVRGSSAAVTKTPERAETVERQGEDSASEQKVDNKGEGQEEEGSTSQHQSSIPPKQLQGTSEAGVTVAFHVLVSSVFEFSDRKLSIRTGGVEFGDFECSCVDLCAVDQPNKRKEKDYLQHFRGQLTLTPDQALEGTSYSYVVTTGENQFWEDLTEFLSRRGATSNIRRALKIPNDHIQPGVTWNQFDGVAYFYDEQSDLKLMDQKAEYYTMAFHSYLPKWKGFLLNEATDMMNATEALTRLDIVVECLSGVWVQEGLSQPKKKSTSFNDQKVLFNLLTPKLEANITILTKSKFGSMDHLSALISSLAIIVVFNKYSIHLKREKRISLLRCLSFEAELHGELHSVCEKLLAEFNIELRKTAAKALESLYNKWIKFTTKKIDLSWFLAVFMSTPARNEDTNSSDGQILGTPETTKATPTELVSTGFTSGERPPVPHPRSIVQLVSPDAGLTVVFHVLLASNFKMTDERLFIRANGAALGDFQENCVDMVQVETDRSKDNDKLTLFRGKFILDLDRARKDIFYKYLVVKKGVLHWEELPEAPSSFLSEGIFNRAIRIPENGIKAGATWNQFDGVTYVYGKMSMVSKVVDYFSGKDKTPEFRKKALLCFLPKWKGFRLDGTPVKMDATEAVKSLFHVVGCLSNVWAEESGNRRKGNLTDFNVPMVLLDHLKPKMKENVSTLAKCQVGTSDHVSAVVSSLAILLVVNKYAIGLKGEELNAMLSCLALQANATDKTCSSYEALLNEFDTELRQSAVSAIETICNQSMKQVRNSTPEWLLALPLLHFLRGDSKPFEEPDIGELPENSAWWGAQKLAITEFQRLEKQDFTDVWPRLVGAFQVDLLLKRTFLRALTVWSLQNFVPTGLFEISDVCFALITLFPLGILTNEKKIWIEQCIVSMINIQESGKEIISSNTKIMTFRVSASSKLVHVCLGTPYFREDIELICHAIKLLFLSIQHCQQSAVESHTENPNKLQEIETLKKECLHLLWKELRSKLPSVLDAHMPDNHKSGALSRELEVWSMFLKVTDGTQGFEEYRMYLKEHFMNRAKKVKDTYLVEIFCEHNMEVYDRGIGESISKLAFEAVERIIESKKGKDAHHAFMTLRGSSLRGDSRAAKYGELLSVLLAKSWPKTHRGRNRSGLDLSIVEFLLTWNPIVEYFRFFGDESGRGSILSEEGQETLTKAKSVLTAIVESISKATVTVEILLLLRKNKEKFLELSKTTFITNEEANSGSKRGVERSLDERIEEIEEYQAIKEKVQSFLYMCDLIQPVNVDNIRAKTIKDVSCYQLCQLCERNDDKEVQFKFLEIPPAMKQVLTPLHKVQESSIFQDLWTQYGKKAQRIRKNGESKMPHLSVSEVVEHVWKTAFSEWSKHLSGIVDGTVTLGDVEKLFKGFKSKEKKLECELIRMFQLSQTQTTTLSEELRGVIDDRKAQIQRYQQFCQYLDAAETIWQFKEAMGFTGDFTVIQDLRNQYSAEFKEKPLNSIGERFMEAGLALKSVDFAKEKCFRSLVDSKRLVEWLRAAIKTTQELKVLVDLALISAGESDMETDRISSLHTSCLGFAPLIFDLIETQEQRVGFDQLMKACNPVWKAVEADQLLPRKLYDTSRNLDWLKTVKESHGSVAMTSLVQATTINSSGVYVVGHLDFKRGPSPEQGKRLSLKDVILLTVPSRDGSERKDQKKTYSIDELKDLQSKLMLIAGKAEKGKDDVEQFVRNLEGVMRLAIAYINLYESGFVHRMDWNREFHCENDFVEGKSIAKDLEDESKSMETCYSNWKKMVSDAREEFRELNFFTTQQLMTLRKEIATVCHSSGLAVNNVQVLTLLESVRPNCTNEHLKSAIQRAFKDKGLLDNTKGPAELPSFSPDPLQYEMVTRRSVFEKASYSTGIGVPPVHAAFVKKPKQKKTSKIQSFLNVAADEGFSEQIALAALASLGVDAEEDDLLYWCLEEADEAIIEALYEDAKQNPVTVREIFSKEVDSVDPEFQAADLSVNESGSDLLLDISPKLIEKDLADQKTSKDEEAEISQYLTLTQLGNFLTELSVKGKQATPRTFPAFLKRGRPNLMLVPKGEILATVLTLYMHDKQQPLPSHEEVLLCSPETTTEEIELLWRRAIGDMEGRFYCLVHADVLDFSVSKQAMDMLRVVTQGLAGKPGENYGLVVICSSENEDRANVVAALDQYRVASPPCPSPEVLKKYLKRQLKAPPPQHGFIGSSKITWTVAGSLDPERLCVRVVSSHRGGMGKTLFVRRLTEQLPDLANNEMVVTNLRSQDCNALLHVTVPLHGNSTDSSMVVDALLPHTVKANVPLSRIFHVDVSPSMRRGLDTLLFNLLVLGYLCDKMGRVWRRRTTDLYVIEVTTAAPLPTGLTKEEEYERQGVGKNQSQSGRSTLSKRPFYDLLPTVHCNTPRTVLRCLADTQDLKDCNPLFDVKEFQNAPFQRVYHYFKLSTKGKSLDNFTFLPENVDDDRKTCLSLLLSNCGIPDPSWSEIRHFVSFLNSQLKDWEKSLYCDMKLMRTILAGPNVLNLEGFWSFVVRFMIQMSRDFATPSLTDENPVFYTEDNVELEQKEIEQFQLRRSWESSPHPYLFFNQDHITLTFLGFFINSAGDLVDPQTGQTLERGLMSKRLRNGLQAQRIDFTTNIETSRKRDKINQLCSVMGVNWLHDPDNTYELTTDNVKKILAIHMRFRCNIPVIVMGETGCGKTRLIRYLCALQAGPKGPRNMLLIKVHGGTTYEDIELKVRQAEDMARANQDKNIDTVLFFDEANTTEALTMIKEVMVDRRINGRPIGQGLQRLQFIAACNPYKRHTDDMIRKLESEGLGYHVNAHESEDRLGHIPLRHLVYRVHALPGSMRPLIWDFGQLKPDVERLYTNQIVNRYIIREKQLPGDSFTVQAVAEVLAASQKYMRAQSDECSFVSLRDVERAMQVMVWFYEHMDTLGKLMDMVLAKRRMKEGLDDDDEALNPLTRALVLAIGVCYHAKLQKRREGYRIAVAKSFKAPCILPGGQERILREISSCQKAVLNDLELGPNIARNTALSENVFMMVVCIELRIPLFVVGKPGSSKSLAKTVVADNMQGDAARSPLFKTFKQVHMASYQCSPLSTPEGIMATFKQCSKLQEGKNLDKFVSVVVLDEVGLAEDSPLMPLKTLHPLLEEGVTSADDVIETDEKPQRVAFVGISNWALDPAKMNRGIMLSRGVPEKDELVDSAMGICSTDVGVKNLIQPLISPLADGYAELYKKQKHFATLKKWGKEEFFGLRDFYSLIKMVYSIAAKSEHRPCWSELEHAIKRNFGGLIEGDPVEIFKRYYPETDDDVAKACTTIRLIEASLGREDVADRTNFSENRYLLILTENYAALPIVQQLLLKRSEDAVVIFGSSFPNDQEYTQICRNINRIKVCMETGRTVILLNLESLYESLYDALNQYYVYFGGQKYVDLGLGTHRVKCRVHDDFKLIVIAEKDVVYNKFPIPLINRLEKHFLVTLTSLTPEQGDVVQEMNLWACKFSEVSRESGCNRDFSIGDAFVGFHDDTIPSIVMQVCNENKREENLSASDRTEDTKETKLMSKVLRRCQMMLLEMATPDAIARLPYTALESEARSIWNVYFKEQQHSSLAAFMSHVLTLNDNHQGERRQEGLSIQVTTHSRLLSNKDLDEISNQTDFRRSNVVLMTLQQFQTEQQFRASVRDFFKRLGGKCPCILVVQCDSGDENFNLIAGARHILLEERTNAPEILDLPSVQAVHILLVIQLPRIAGGCHNFVGFQGGKWMSAHIDELRPPGGHTPSIEQLTDRPISELCGLGSGVAMAVELLRNCVQAAACRIDSETESAERSTHRIELLLDLLPDDYQTQRDEESFASVLVQRTYYLLMEKEATAYDAQIWLHSEALSGTGVQEWGTFRKALLQRMYSVVVPILAEIIAFADRDMNLDLVKSDNSWVSKLWLKILADPTFSELSYSEMISPATNSVRERVQVIGSGAEGHKFCSRFPFSFLIKERVENMVKEASSTSALPGSSTTLLVALRDMIDNSQLGLLFKELRHEDSVASQYLMDFVHMVHKPSNDNEYELVYEAILSSARELGILDDEDDNESIDIALVHVAHSRVQHRLKYFDTIVKMNPSLIPRLREVLQGSEPEVLLDVVALQICLEAIEPSREMLLFPDTRQIWCDRVLSMRPAVEDMIRKERFGPVTEKCSNYGERSTVLLDRCRSMWQRIGAVRLFIEHVTLFAEEDEKANSENVTILWKALGDETDFSSLRSLQALEKFLVNYSEDVRQRTNEKAATELRRRCNAFFMELVSIFCFGDSVSKDLEQEAITLLMHYVVGHQSSQTKDFSPFPDHAIDPTPVVCSFLLQLLLRSRTELVKNHLGDFLKGAKNLKREPSHIKEVSLLYVQCREDLFVSQYQAKFADRRLTLKLKHATENCEGTVTALTHIDEDSAEMSARSLEGVAKGRFVLSLVVELLYKLFIEGDSSYRDEKVKREVTKLLVSARKLCLEMSSSTPQLYLLKQLVRRYGLDCVRTLGQFKELEWILPSETRQQEDVILDRFLVHGDHYRAVREGLAKTVISGNIQDIVSVITEAGSQVVYNNVPLLLAMYRELTMENVSPVQTQNLSQEVRKKLDDFITNGGHFSETAQPFAKELLANRQGGHLWELQIYNGKSPQEQTLAEIVIHTAVALQCVGSGSLAQPLFALMSDPSTMNNSFLPTMPEDNYLECINVIAETMKGTGWVGEWYECSNLNCRHPYFIGECSKPMEKSTCPGCGRVLGGEQLTFSEVSKVSNRKDRTKTGHALGVPGSRPTHAEPQRDMPPVVCSLLRTLMQSAMVMGASKYPQEIAQLITPPCPSQCEGQFLWQHLQRDLDVLGRALGRSVDDAALTVHLALQRMIFLNGG